MAGGWLARLGLRTREQRAWATYDWANSAFQCTIITAVFPIYFAKVAAEGMPDALATARFAMATTVALTVTAILAPVLGAYADYAGVKKRLLGVFLGLGVTATAAMYLIGPGDWKLAAWLFIASNICISASLKGSARSFAHRRPVVISNGRQCIRAIPSSNQRSRRRRRRPLARR